MRKCLLLLFCLLAAVLQAQATATGEMKDSLWRQLDLGEVVVTGTRTAKYLKDTPIQTLVITSKDIARADATNIQDLLQQEMPGVEFTYAMNQQTHMNFSGFGGQGILFLVDGERLAGETMDDVDFSRLSMDNVERIEIIKGAASALYGSNATGGVINIITKDSREPWTVNVNARYAKHNEQRYGLSFGRNSNHWSNMLSAHYNSMDNYDVHNAANPATRVISTVYGDRVLNVNDKLTWRPSDAFSVTGRAGYFFRQMARTPDVPERYRDFSGGLSMKWNISDDDDLHVNYAFDQYDKSDYQKIKHLDIRDYSNVRNTIRALYNHGNNRGDVLSIGADYMYDYLFNVNIDGNTCRQKNLDVFAQYDWRVAENLEVVGALRYDYQSDGSQSHVTPKLNLRYIPHDNVTLRAGYGMGFRAPTLKEKYYVFDMSGIWIVEGNPDLRSETSHNFNASVEYAKGVYRLTASAYYNKVHDKLATAAPYYKTQHDKMPYLPYTNLENYRVYGGELSAQAHWTNGLSARITYAYTKEELPKDNDGHAINNQYIPARAHSLNLCADYDHQFSEHYGLDVCISGRVLSAVENEEFRNYYDINAGTLTVSYPAYSLWKLSMTHRLGTAVKITAALDNLLNYKPKYYYLNSPITDGINLQIGMSVSF